ncbi:tail fiber domain-containing protein [Burkholderia gladioli]|uniref:tail fiber domain-containing protein n=1 Tax=Burkholderia gladioli TaxID=28095 RepID=UPI00163E4FF5|nr:tail fiber domain-containing protein [Burkholderia gladioli]
MTTLQQINLGNPPDGSGGDTVRTANAKINGNTSIIDACVPIGYQILGANKTLALADVGTRIGLFFQQAGGTMVMPLANTVRQNGVIHFFNIGNAVTIGFQGNDSASITRINAGDCITYVSDGASYWHVAARGKVGADEAVVGSLSVGGSLAAGAMTASGLLTASAGVAVTGGLSVNRSGVEGDLYLGGNDGYYYGNANAAGWFSPTKGSFYYSFANQTFNIPSLSVAGSASVVGAASVGSLKINGNTAWDAGNFNPANYAALSGANFTGPVSTGDFRVNTSANNGALSVYSDTAGEMVVDAFSRSSGTTKYAINLAKYGGTVTVGSARFVSSGAASGQYTGASVWAKGPSNSSGYVAISNGSSAVQIRVAATSNPSLEVVGWDSSAYSSITCLSVTQTSDEALKGDVEELGDVLEMLRDKRIVTFRYKVPASSGGGLSEDKHVGVIAQEWASDFPELVRQLDADIDADGDFIAHQYDSKTGEEIFGRSGAPISRKALGFNYANASAVALKGVIQLERALQAALDRIAELEKKVS